MNIDLSYEYTNLSHEYVLGQVIGASQDISRLAYFPSYAHVGSKVASFPGLPCALHGGEPVCHQNNTNRPSRQLYDLYTQQLQCKNKTVKHLNVLIRNLQ